MQPVLDFGTLGPVSLRQRADWYAATFPQWPGSWLHATPTMLQGAWILGNDYRGSGYHGAYPPGYLRRVRALFLDVPVRLQAHLFSGSLAPDVGGVRIDANATLRPTVAADAQALPFATGALQLTFADPPYSATDAARYGFPMIDRRRVLREVARATAPGGFLVWLDTVLPMFRKDAWSWVGQIGVVVSTNHQYRMVSIFQRTSEAVA